MYRKKEALAVFLQRSLMINQVISPKPVASRVSRFPHQLQIKLVSLFLTCWQGLCKCVACVVASMRVAAAVYIEREDSRTEESFVKDRERGLWVPSGP